MSSFIHKLTRTATQKAIQGQITVDQVKRAVSDKYTVSAKRGQGQGGVEYAVLLLVAIAVLAAIAGVTGYISSQFGQIGGGG
jgi:Flp pilus assembly pilin Flp